MGNINGTQLFKKFPPEVLGIIGEYAQKAVYMSAKIGDPEDARKGNTYHIQIDQYTISPLTKTRLNTKFDFDRLTTNVMMEIINGLKNPPPRSRRQYYNHVYGDRNTAYMIYYDYIDFNLIIVESHCDSLDRVGGLPGLVSSQTERLALLRIFENLHEMVQRLESERGSPEREGLAHVTLFADGSILQTADEWNPVYEDINSSDIHVKSSLFFTSQIQ